MTDFVDTDVYATLPLRISHLPFDTDGSIDFEKRFTKPFDKARFDELFAMRTGANGEEIEWPKSNARDPSCIAQAWARKVSHMMCLREGGRDCWSIPKTSALIENTHWFACSGQENIILSFPPDADMARVEWRLDITEISTIWGSAEVNLSQHGRHMVSTPSPRRLNHKEKIRATASFLTFRVYWLMMWRWTIVPQEVNSSALYSL